MFGKEKGPESGVQNADQFKFSEVKEALISLAKNLERLPDFSSPYAPDKSMGEKYSAG